MKSLRKLALKAIASAESLGLKVIAWINDDTHGPCDW